MSTGAIAVSLLSLSLHFASAAPLTPLESQLLAANGNKTVLNSEIAPAWATISNIRSTASLLWTCVLTLSICVYTVIHINIPPPNETQCRYFLRKTKWVVVAILAPELALAMALQQWSAARALRNELSSIYSKYSDGKVDAAATEKFSMTYCFYAVMGGFVVDVSDIHDTHSLLTFQPFGIVSLAKKGHFMKISEKAIKDKSKADILAKSLVCIQVCWMIIQCIGRKAAGLPISLLEINVLVHVACALCMYALWIEKPLDIQDPTIVDTSKFPDEVALMLMGSSCNNEIYLLDLILYDPNSGFSNDVRGTTCDDGDFQANRAEQSSPIERDSSSAYQIVTHKPLEDRSYLCEYHESSRKGGCKIEPGQSLPCGLGLKHNSDYWLRLSDKDVQRWTRATKAMRQEPDKYKPGQWLHTPGGQLQRRSENFQDQSLKDEEVQGVLDSDLIEDPLFWLMLVALPMVYGSIHLTAWNFDFPSRVEQIMWRATCIIIAGGIPGSYVLYCIIDDIHFRLVRMGYCIFGKGWTREKVDEKMWAWLTLHHSLSRGLSDLEGFILIVLFLGFVPLYFCARLFLVVESFISTRRLPLGVFVTVQWANYIPHL